MRFVERKVTKEKFYVAKSIETKTNSNYLIRYSDKTIRPCLIMPKMSGYVKTFKVKDGDKDKNNKLMSFQIDKENILQKYEVIWTTIQDFKTSKLNALPVYEDRYIETKIRAYGNKVRTNFCGLSLPKDDTKCESFTVISIDSLPVYENRCYLQVY